MMNCQQMQKLMSRFQDGELPAELKSEALLHLESCPDCSAELAAYEKVRDGLLLLPVHEPSPGFAAGVMGRIHSAPKRRRFWIPVFAYSLLFLLVFAAGFFLSPKQKSYAIEISEQTLTAALMESQSMHLYAIQDQTFPIFSGAHHE